MSSTMNKSLSRLLLGTSLLLGAPFMLPESTLEPAQARAACDVSCRYHCRKVFFKEACRKKCKQEQKVSCKRTKPTITVTNICRYKVGVKVRYRRKNGDIYHMPKRVLRPYEIFGKDSFGSWSHSEVLDPVGAKFNTVSWKIPAAGLSPEYKISLRSNGKYYGLDNQGKWRRLMKKDREFLTINPYTVRGRRNIKINCS